MTPAVAGSMFVAANAALWLLVLAVQNIEARAGRIASRGRWSSPAPFLYFQDWHMATWGDWIGLSFIDFMAGYIVSAITIAPAVWISSLAIGATGAAAFHMRCLYYRHRPDSGYPAHGRASLFGLVHLVYFYLQCVACTLSGITAIEGKLPPKVLAAGLIGAVIYLASVALDWRKGKLSPDPSI